MEYIVTITKGFPRSSVGKICLQCKRPRFTSWVGQVPWRRKWQPTPVFLPGESHRQRSLAGYSPLTHQELDMAEAIEHTGNHYPDNHYIYYCGQESLGRNGIALRVNKGIQNAVLGCNIKNNRMILVHFQGKPFNITVIQVYAPPIDAEEAEVHQFYEDLQYLLELTPEKNVLFIIRE